MAYYYKINEIEDHLPLYEGFHLRKVKNPTISEPKISFDFSKHVLIELLDDTTPESKLWCELGLTNNKSIRHKRMMFDPHRIKCRKAVVICVDSEEAKLLAERVSQAKIMNRCICATVVQNLLSDLCLFEKQIIQCGDNRPQHQLLYVSDLSRSRGPKGLADFLKEKFSPFGTILSVLVSSDKDDYAVPEGVIKFAYLSEAFAAEVAYDQYVIGKERLSVTTHHNILLSQCDLRVRLREAQWCYNVENISSESPFHSYNQTSELSLSHHDRGSVASSLNSLCISHRNDDKATVNNKTCDLLKDNLPAYSQFNSDKNILKKDLDNTTTYTKKTKWNKNVNHSDILAMHDDSAYTKAIENHNSDDHNTNYVNEDIESETIPFEMATTNVINHIYTSENCQILSRKQMNFDSVLSIGRSQSMSDCNSFNTCNSGTNLDSQKEIFSSFHSYGNKTVSDYQSLPPDFEQVTNSLNDTLNDSNMEKLETENSTKRKKRFALSQRLCLKSQRTGLSQKSVQIPSTASQVPDSSISHSKMSLESGNSQRKKEIGLCIATKQNIMHTFSASKVANWLHHLPQNGSEAFESSSEDKENAHSRKTFMEKEPHKDKISLHKTPALKPNSKFAHNHKATSADNRSFEDSVASSDKSIPVPSLGKYNSPLQAWLKQELILSTNNSVVKSQETSKSMIVCATKSKDVIISVGCSHMTCDSCYPESNDLLLGYS